MSARSDRVRKRRARRRLRAWHRVRAIEDMRAALHRWGIWDPAPEIVAVDYDHDTATMTLTFGDRP